MNFCDLNQRISKIQDNKNHTSNSATVDVQRKSLPNDLTPLSFKDMVSGMSPDYEEPQVLQTMQVSNNLQGYGGGYNQIGKVALSVRPEYEQVY